MNYKDKTVAISGAGGFIGRNLAGILIEQGAKVAAIPTEILVNPPVLQNWLEKANPDIIFHLAAYGNHSTQKEEDEVFAANVFKTYILLTASKKIPYEAFINFSTSSVYGNYDKPFREDFELKGRGFYARTKKCSEELVKAFVEKYDLPITTVRPFSVYGPGEGEHRFIPTIIRHLVTEDEMTLYPEPVHDWIYIEDFISGVDKCVDNVDNLKGEATNIGMGNQYSNREIYDMLCDIHGKTVDVDEKESPRYNDVNYWVANNERLKEMGWRSKFSLKEGLEETYKFYKKYYEEREPTKDLDEAMKRSLDMVGSEFKDVEDEKK